MDNSLTFYLIYYKETDKEWQESYHYNSENMLQVLKMAYEYGEKMKASFGKTYRILNDDHKTEVSKEILDKAIKM